MDEPDKFMDDSYRKQLLELLLEVFREQRNRQIFILTPLDYAALFRDLCTTEQLDDLGLVFHRLPKPRPNGLVGVEIQDV